MLLSQGPCPPPTPLPRTAPPRHHPPPHHHHGGRRDGTKVPQDRPRVRPCPSVAMQVFCTPGRSLRTRAGAAESVGLTGSDESPQTADTPGGHRGPILFTLPYSLLLSCSAQSVSGVSEKKSEKEKSFKPTGRDTLQVWLGLPSKMNSLWFPRLPTK